MHIWVLAHPGMAGIQVSSSQPAPFPLCHPQEEEQGTWVKWEPCTLVSSKEWVGWECIPEKKERERETWARQSQVHLSRDCSSCPRFAPSWKEPLKCGMPPRRCPMPTGELVDWICQPQELHDQGKSLQTLPSVHLGEAGNLPSKYIGISTRKYQREEKQNPKWPQGLDPAAEPSSWNSPSAPQQLQLVPPFPQPLPLPIPGPHAPSWTLPFDPLPSSTLQLYSWSSSLTLFLPQNHGVDLSSFLSSAPAYSNFMQEEPKIWRWEIHGAIRHLPTGLSCSHLDGYCLSDPKPFTLYLIITSSVPLPRHLPCEGPCVSFATATHSSSISDKASQKVAGNTESTGKTHSPWLGSPKISPCPQLRPRVLQSTRGKPFSIPSSPWLDHGLPCHSAGVTPCACAKATLQSPWFSPTGPVAAEEQVGGPWSGTLAWMTSQALSVDKTNTLSCTPSSLHLASPLLVSSDAPLTIHRMTNWTWLRRKKRLSSAPLSLASKEASFRSSTCPSMSMGTGICDSERKTQMAAMGQPLGGCPYERSITVPKNSSCRAVLGAPGEHPGAWVGRGPQTPCFCSHLSSSSPRNYVE